MLPEKKIIINIEDEMKTSYMDYAMSVIIGRALPDIRDGLKPVHRRVMFSMHELGLAYNKPYKKSARVVGEVLGKYHPHGDAAVYDAIIRMVQDFSLRYPLIDGQGNFGSVDGDSAAAMRYTEVKLAKIAHEMLTDIDKETVDFAPNFDDTLVEPKILPARIPNLLINGSSGIAVGMATNIPPHNLSEVVDALIFLIDNPEAEIDKLMNIVKGPDFPTGAYIYGSEGINEAYKKGRGVIQLRAKAHIEKLKSGKESIIVTELPYQVNKARLIENIAGLIRDKKIEGISDLRDESDRNGMRIVIELKKNEIARVILNQLFKHTQMQSTFGVIMLALVNNQPRIVNLKGMLTHFIQFRKEIVTRRIKFDLEKAQERAHILEGLKIALDKLDLVISLIRKSESVEQAKNALCSNLNLTEKQAQAILEMRLQRLTRLEREKITEEYGELLKTISRLKSILASEPLLMNEIKNELEEIKKQFGDERRTEILYEITEINIEDLIAEEDMVITVTNSGYIKRSPTSLYRSQRRGGKGMIAMDTKEEDFLRDLYVASTHSHMLFFTNLGKVYCLKVHEIPEASRQAKGKAIVNLLQLSSEERVAALVCIKEFEKNMFLFMTTKRGIVKKTPLIAFSHLRGRGIIGLTLQEGDELISVELTDGSQEVLLGTSRGKMIKFKEDLVRPTGRASMGVKGIRLQGEDSVVGAEILRPGDSIFTVTEKGFGKRTELSNYSLQRRGGVGVRGANVSKKTRNIVGLLQVRQDDDLMIVTTKGKVIRLSIAEVRTTGRSSMGVKVIELEEDDLVGSIARVEASEKEQN